MKRISLQQRLVNCYELLVIYEKHFKTCKTSLFSNNRCKVKMFIVTKILLFNSENSSRNILILCICKIFGEHFEKTEVNMLRLIQIIPIVNRLFLNQILVTL